MQMFQQANITNGINYQSRCFACVKWFLKFKHVSLDSNVLENQLVGVIEKSTQEMSKNINKMLSSFLLWLQTP